MPHIYATNQVDAENEKSKLNTSSIGTQARVLVFGTIGVGKSSIVQRYIHHTFDAAKKFSRFHSMQITKELMVVDCSRYENPDYLQNQNGPLLNSIGGLLVFSLTKQKSFADLKEALETMVFYVNGPIVLVGNKRDDAAERVITSQQAIEFAMQNNLSYVEVSAKEGTNIEFAFNVLKSEIVEKLSVNEDVSEQKETLPNLNALNTDDVDELSDENKDEEQKYNAIKPELLKKITARMAEMGPSRLELKSDLITKCDKAKTFKDAEAVLNDLGNQAQESHEKVTGWHWFHFFGLIRPTSNFKQITQDLVNEYNPRPGQSKTQ